MLETKRDTKHETKRAANDILRKGFDEYRQFVNPLIAQRASMANEPVKLVSTENGRLVDNEGRRIEDLHGTQAFGHRPPEIAAALQEFLESDAPSWYPGRVSPFSGRLARMLCERSGYEQVYFGCTGSDAVEAALKLARAATRKPGIVALDRGYHGCTFGSVSLMNPGPFRDPFGPHLPGVRHIAFADADALKAELEKGDVGAVVVEPVQGEGGVRALSDEYIGALCELTEKHDAFLIADEVQTALGRSGAFVATADWPRRPEVVCMGKQLGGGMMPVSACLTYSRVFEQAYGRNFMEAEAHNSTFSYNALGAVAGIAALDYITDELVESVRVRGQEFRRLLTESLQGNPLFQEVRGRGFMCGVVLKETDHPWLSFKQFGYKDTLKERQTIGPLLCHRLYRRGFFAFVCGHDWRILRMQPRFNIEEATLQELAKAIREELDYLLELAE